MANKENPRHLLRDTASSSFIVPAMKDVETFTLYHMGTKKGHDVFVPAIKSLLSRYSILGGKILKRKNQYWIEECTEQKPENYLTVVDFSNDTPTLNQDTDSLVNFLRQHVISKLAKPLSVQQRLMKRRQPFHVTLVELPDGYVCCRFTVCHLLADAHSFYQIMNQFHQLCSGTDVGTMDNLVWSKPTFVKKDLDPLKILGVDSVLGVLRTACFPSSMPFSVSNSVSFVEIDKRKIGELKITMKTDDVEYLSTNDILTSIICQTAFPLELVITARNDRKIQGEPDGSMGVFLSHGLLCAASAAGNPSYVRQHITSRDVPKHLDKRRLRRGRFITMSNWISAGSSWTYPTASSSIKHVAEVPHPSFIAGIPAGLVLIARHTETTILLIHNLPENWFNKEGQEKLEYIKVCREGRESVC